MKIISMTHPIIIIQAHEELMYFHVHVLCLCGREASRYVKVPTWSRPILVCKYCQEKCVVTFPIH